jgi:hypothetical protein
MDDEAEKCCGTCRHLDRTFSVPHLYRVRRCSNPGAARTGSPVNEALQWRYEHDGTECPCYERREDT